MILHRGSGVCGLDVCRAAFPPSVRCPTYTHEGFKLRAASDLLG